MKGQKWYYLLIKDNTEDAVACIESNLPIKADKLCTEVIHLNGYHAISISKEEYLLGRKKIKMLSAKHTKEV